MVMMHGTGGARAGMDAYRNRATNSATVIPAARISDLSSPRSSSRCCGTDSTTASPSLPMMTWLLCWRRNRQPAFSNTRTASAPEQTGRASATSGCDGEHCFLDLDALRKVHLAPTQDAALDGLPHVRHQLVDVAALRDAAGQLRRGTDKPAVIAGEVEDLVARLIVHGAQSARGAGECQVSRAAAGFLGGGAVRRLEGHRVQMVKSIESTRQNVRFTKLSVATTAMRHPPQAGFCIHWVTSCLSTSQLRGPSKLVLVDRDCRHDSSPHLTRLGASRMTPNRSLLGRTSSVDVRTASESVAETTFDGSAMVPLASISAAPPNSGVKRRCRCPECGGSKSPPSTTEKVSGRLGSAVHPVRSPVSKPPFTSTLRQPGAAQGVDVPVPKRAVSVGRGVKVAVATVGPGLAVLVGQKTAVRVAEGVADGVREGVKVRDGVGVNVGDGGGLGVARARESGRYTTPGAAARSDTSRAISNRHATHAVAAARMRSPRIAVWRVSLPRFAPGQMYRSTACGARDCGVGAGKCQVGGGWAGPAGGGVREFCFTVGTDGETVGGGPGGLTCILIGCYNASEQLNRMTLAALPTPRVSTKELRS